MRCSAEILSRRGSWVRIPPSAFIGGTMRKNVYFTNEELMETVKKIKKDADSRFWKAVLRKISRPRRKRIVVNLWKLNKYTSPNESVVVPGVVLAYGEIKHPVNVAALRFSVNAKSKILKAGGKVLTISEMFEENPKGSHLKIII